MKHFNVPVFGIASSAVLTILQTMPVFQIVQLVLTCIATLVTIAYTLWKWYNSAKKDGKIDSEEIEEALHIVADGVEEIKDLVQEVNIDDNSGK